MKSTTPSTPDLRGDDHSRKKEKEAFMKEKTLGCK